MNSKILVSSIVAVAAGAAFVSTGIVSAHQGGANLTDEQKVAKMDERKQKMEDRLDSLVTDGKLTAEQRTALDAKLSAMNDKRQALHDSDATRTEVRAAMDTFHAEIKTWADENKITLSDILPGRAEGSGHGQGAGQNGFRNQ